MNISRFVIILITFFISNPVTSYEWKLVYENKFNNDKVFIDISNITKQDGLLYFWDMLNHKEFNTTHDYWSVTAYIEANCEEFWYRKLILYMHKEKMALSEPFFETKNRSFIILKPKRKDSGQYILLKEACNLSD